jgi:dihydrofolate reductase
MPDIRLIAAVDDKRGLARDGKIPWDLPSDRQRFRELTDGQIVILGKQTYEEMKLMLGKRKAYVVAYANEPVENAEVVQDLPAFLQSLKEDAWVIGGGQIFALALPYATQLYLTHVAGDFGCDTYFPEFKSRFVSYEADGPHQENGIGYIYKTWRPKSG